jgi:hypothetical protein
MIDQTDPGFHLLKSVEPQKVNGQAVSQGSATLAQSHSDPRITVRLNRRLCYC